MTHFKGKAAGITAAASRSRTAIADAAAAAHAIERVADIGCEASAALQAQLASTDTTSR